MVLEGTFLIQSTNILNHLRIWSPDYFCFEVLQLLQVEFDWDEEAKVITLLPPVPRECSACVTVTQRSPTKFPLPRGSPEREVRVEIQQHKSGRGRGWIIKQWDKCKCLSVLAWVWCGCDLYCNCVELRTNLRIKEVGKEGWFKKGCHKCRWTHDCFAATIPNVLCPWPTERQSISSCH